MQSKISTARSWCVLLLCGCCVNVSWANTHSNLKVPTQQAESADPRAQSIIAAASQRFVVHGVLRPRKVQKISVLCEGFESATCNKSLRAYNGLRGALLSEWPIYRSDLYLGYSAILQNGERLVYRVPRWKQFDHVFEASDFIIDQKHIDEAEALVGRSFSSNLTVAVSALQLESGIVYLVTEQGTRLPLKSAQSRLAFLDQFVDAKDHDRIFASLDHVTLRKPDNHTWSIVPNNLQDMPIYGDVLLGGSKQLNMVVHYQGWGDIGFKEVSVTFDEDRNQPSYTHKFQHGEIERMSKGQRVSEQASIPVSEKELSLLFALVEKPAKVRFSGEYRSEIKFDADFAARLRALLDIYTLISLPDAQQLASR